jgi:hypothetical protein
MPAGDAAVMALCLQQLLAGRQWSPPPQTPCCRTRSTDPADAAPVPCRCIQIWLHLSQVTKREDSAAYAARTLSEIETCLGFRIHEGAEAEAESLSAADIEVSSQAAAPQQGVPAGSHWALCQHRLQQQHKNSMQCRHPWWAASQTKEPSHGSGRRSPRPYLGLAAATPGP